MSRDQLATVCRFAERREKEAGTRLSRAHVELASAENTLAQIVEYRDDYHRLATGSSGNLTGVHRLESARYFLSQLDKMAAKQRSAIQQAELALDHHRTSWITAKHRLTAFEKLRAQRQKNRDIANEKRHQRTLDELYSLKTNFLERP